MSTAPNESLLKKIGWDKVWVPNSSPPDLGTVPLDFPRMSSTEVGEWQSKCTAWLSYAIIQEGLANSHHKELRREFARRVNETIVREGIKQRTYDLQVAEAVDKDPNLAKVQEEIASWDSVEHMWSRAQEAYKSYTQLCRDEIYRRSRDHA